MRKLIALIALLPMLVLAGCSSSSEPLAFDLNHAMSPPEQPFYVVGASADEGVVCSSGRFVGSRVQNMDGDEISVEEWSQMFDTAIEDGTAAEIISYKEFVCADGSGSITIADHVLFDFGVLNPDSLGRGEIAAGTWTITGTGEYDSLSGSGETVIDFEQNRFHYAGEVTG